MPNFIHIHILNSIQVKKSKAVMIFPASREGSGCLEGRPGFSIGSQPLVACDASLCGGKDPVAWQVDPVSPLEDDGSVIFHLVVRPSSAAATGSRLCSLFV
ncbi:hypothetical protein PanWU01x14_011740 [Parasponia andersonii]|uniref:Uncharacterized protein n=1 Tax=Parasponia andersonii TaxID=3476 RepID=A0A2P5E1L6_PARAD|nr:hypothetical protein PanWU01x14_011740 [Parasponia andersonii]